MSDSISLSSLAVLPPPVQVGPTKTALAVQEAANQSSVQPPVANIVVPYQNDGRGQSVHNSTDSLAAFAASGQVFPPGAGSADESQAGAPTSPLFAGTGPNGTPKVIGHVSSRPHSSAEQTATNGAPPEHHWYDRPLGALQAIGGLGEMAIGGALLAAPEPTGLTKVGGAIVGLHGIDDLQAGVRTAITGNPTQTATQQVVTSGAQALGATAGTATALGAIVDGGLGMANPEGEAGKVVRGAVELSDAEHAAQNASKLEHGAAAATDAEKTTATAKTGAAATDVAAPRTGSPGGWPTGVPEGVPSNNSEMARSLQRQNESANTLAALGYDVEHQPTVHPSDGTSLTKNPDLRVGGQIFDVYAPKSAKVRNVIDSMEDKVASGQTQRLVVNITDSPLTKADLTTALKHDPVAGLRELIVIDGKDSSVTRVFPDPQTLK